MPLLEGSARQAALDAAAECVRVAPPTSTLGSGQAARALLAAYLFRSNGDEEMLALARTALDASAADLGELAGRTELFEGVAGVAWAAEHAHAVTRGGLEAFDCDDVDEVIADSLDSFVPQPPHALVEGGVGTGLYELDRLPRDAARRAIAQLVAELDRTKIEDVEGIRWMHRSEPPLVALGPAHGVAGAIVFLARVVAARIVQTSDVARRLLEGSVGWLLAQRLDDGTGSVFPHPIRAGVAKEPSSLGWCNGDPGIAAALLTASRVSGRDDWRLAALDIALAAAGRRGEHVSASHLCCGSAGIAHLMNRMYQATGDDRLRASAQRWLDFTLERRSSWGSSPALLTGATGIALAVLAASTDVDPGWDRILAVSA